MKTFKRIISVLLSLLVIISVISISFNVYAEKRNEDNINVNLLESVINDRYWILDTLLNGDYSSNPYAVINPASNNRFLIKDIVENYKKDLAIKSVINALDIYYESGDYASGLGNYIKNLGEEDILALLSLFGINNAEGLFDPLDKTVRSVAEIRYESVLTDVLKENYTSTWGETLQDSNMELEHLQQLSDVLGKLSKYQKALQDEFELSHSESSELILYKDPQLDNTGIYELTLEDYCGHFFDAYEQDLKEYIHDNPVFLGNEKNGDLRSKIVGMGLFGMISLYNSAALPKMENDLDEIFYDGMFEDSKKILSGVGKTIEFANNSIDLAILMNSLVSQKDSMVGVMNRIAENTSDSDLEKVLLNYADLTEAAGNDKIISYESITNYLRSNNVVTNLVKKKLQKSLPDIAMEAAYKIGGAKGLVLESNIAASLGEAYAIFAIGMWLINSATNIEKTVKQIHLAKYTEKIIDQAVSTCRADLRDYFADKTNENANKVLDDLEFIKALRLYGEKTAYDCIKSQTDSFFADLLSGNEEANEFIDEEYQAQVDLLIGCSITPVHNIPVTFNSGDIVSIRSVEINHRTYTYATYRTKGDVKYIGEADYRLLGGVILNGATLNVLEAPKGFYLPVVQSKGTSNINVYCNDVALGSVCVTNGTLDINAKEDLIIADRIENSGTLNFTSAFNAEIELYDMINRGTINIDGCGFNAKGFLENNGTVNGMVNVCGDGTQMIENSYCRPELQWMSGSGTYSDLEFNNLTQKGVQIYGSQTVTNSISNSSSRLRTSENIYLTGSCSIVNNRFKGSLSFRNYSTPQPVTIDGYGCMYGSNTFGGNTVFNDGLLLSDSCQTLTLNGETTVKGDMLYKAGKINGSNWLKINGDLNITASSPSISNLDFTGLTSQTVSSSSALTVNQLDTHNLSLSGVDFDSKIYITGCLKSDRMTKFVNGKNITLTGNAVCEAESLKGSISAENWSCTNNTSINGSLFASGNININSGVNLTVSGYNQSGGTLTVNENGLLYCKGDYVQNGTTTNSGTICIDGDSLINGEMTGGELIVKGDVSAAAAISLSRFEFNSKIAQSFTNSSTTQTDILELNNSSLSGVTINSLITVNTNYINNDSKVVNSENIIFNGSGAEVMQKDFTIGGTYTVKSGEKLTVDGKLTLNSGASLVVEEGAELKVKKYVVSNGASITVADGGSFEIGGYFSGTNTVINCDGDIVFKDDTLLTGCTVSGEGTLKFAGDLDTSSCTWQNPNVLFESKMPQTVSGSAITVNDITVNNTSRSGIKFNVTVNYYGVLETGTSNISGADKLTAKS